MDILLQIVIPGLLTGLVFALVAAGLTLIYGVMDIVNFAHGEFLMLAMYLAFWMWALWRVDPLLSIPVTALVLFGVGVVTYVLLVRHIIGAPMVAQIFATFGLMVFLRSLAQFLWSPDYRYIGASIASGRLQLLGVFVAQSEVVAAIGAVMATAALYLLLTRTELGRALRAVAEDRQAAELMGIDSQRMFALAWGISAACVGVAGSLLARHFPIFPEVGTIFALTAFVVVALGGFGSVVGALVAGILVGLLQVASGLLLQPALKYVPVLALYLAVVLVRPRGLLGWAT
jgi:branched-chain amino acid transport system permease protein